MVGIPNVSLGVMAHAQEHCGMPWWPALPVLPDATTLDIAKSNEIPDGGTQIP